MDKKYAHMSDEELDQLFRDAAKRHIPPPAPDGAWDHFKEQYLLATGKVQKLPWYKRWVLPFLIPGFNWQFGTACLLVVGVLGWWLLSDQGKTKPVADHTVTQQPTIQQTPADSASIRDRLPEVTDLPIEEMIQLPVSKELAAISKELGVMRTGKLQEQINEGPVPANNNMEKGIITPGQPADNKQQGLPIRPGLKDPEPERKNQVQQNAFYPVAQTVTRKNGSKGNWQMGLLLGSNLGMSAGNVSNKAGFNGGVVVQRKLGGSRFSLESGLIYESMAYSVDNSDFNPGGKPVSNKVSNIEGTCSMIDVPVNVRYDVVQSKKNKAFISTGVSPTVIVKQSYVYDYAGDNGVINIDRDVSGRGKNAYAVANLSIGYEQKWHNMSVQIAPYVKIPMGEIGYGNLNLGGIGTQISIKKTL